MLAGTSPIVLEGETDDDFETTISLDDPTADRTITFPNATGTVITTANDNEIDAVGTVTSGIWQGTAVVDAYVADDLTVASSGTVSAEQLTTTDDLTVEDEASVDGTMTLSTGSITDLSGSISFGDENISTSGTLASGAQTVTGNITSNSTISAEQLTTTDDLTVEDEASIDGTMTLSTGSITDSGGSISLEMKIYQQLELLALKKVLTLVILH